ncbi:ATP-binding protein [Halorubrum aidingense]|uniref:ATP-binding protein n=1 Tax=Halorubrum aidingense TaxID=368623 RepID=UPI0009B5A571|nr:ATP-binding protein [Halorubrum aidingense]
MASSESQHSLISPRLFVRSVRDLGLDTTDAVNEFVDNSFDAAAENVWITLTSNDRGGLTMIVEDDGEGIPQDKLVEVLKFGGKLERDRETTGKFGFGLPSAAFCQSDATHVYSKSADQDEFFYNRLDVSELENMDEVGLLNTEQRNLPTDKYDLHLNNNSNHGTAIIIPHLRDPDRKRPSSLSNHLGENLSRVQREILADGRQIHINGDTIKISDPLVRIEDSEQVNMVGKKSELWGGEPIEFPCEDVEYEGDDPPTFQVYLYKLPIDEIISRELNDELDIGINKQGFYIIRENREIGNSLTLNLFTRHNNLNYFRAKIEFPSELDEKFGVQTNKSRFSLDNDIRRRMEDRLKPQISEIKSSISQERSAAKSKYSAKKGMSPAESKANKKQSWLPRSGYTPDESEVQEQEQEAKEALQELEEDEELSEDQKEMLKEKLTQIIENDQYFEVDTEIPRTGTFYDIEWKGKCVRVKINPSHIFYEEFYKHLTDKTPPLSSSDAEIDKTDIKEYIDLLFISLAKGEDDSYQNDNIKKFYERERRNWSSYLYDFYEND